MSNIEQKYYTNPKGYPCRIRTLPSPSDHADVSEALKKENEALQRRTLFNQDGRIETVDSYLKKHPDDLQNVNHKNHLKLQPKPPPKR